MKQGKTVDVAGVIRYYKDDMFHREDGPAIIWTSGGEEWYKDGVHHREDGPAIDIHGNKEWFFEGKRHRVDGPAEIHTIEPFRQFSIEGVNINDYKPFYIHGKKYDPFDPIFDEAREKYPERFI